jgi:hypothetical protein
MIEILSHGYEIFYGDMFNSIFDPMPKEEGLLVIDVLSLFHLIENFKENNPEDKEVNEHYFSHFLGFDGNNETEYMSFCRFLIHKQGKFSEQIKNQKQTDNFNSHMQVLERYRNMVQVWRGLGKKYAELTRDDILKILNA